MVRFKNRYAVLELIPKNGQMLKLPFKDRDLYQKVKEAIADAHGDYGIGTLQYALNVKYLNPFTHIAMVRTKRGPHKMLISALTFVKKIQDIPLTINTLHIAGTIRSCQKFVTTYHHRQMPLLLQSCKSQGERDAVQWSFKRTVSLLESQRDRTRPDDTGDIFDGD